MTWQPYPIWRDGEVEMFPGHVHKIQGTTLAEQLASLGSQTLWCSTCRAHRDEMERLWVIVHGSGTPHQGR